MTLETQPFDAAPYFDTAEAQAELLAEAFESGEVGFIAAALRTVARAKGREAVVEAAGMTPEGGEAPDFPALLAAAHALGFRLTVEPIAAE